MKTLEQLRELCDRRSEFCQCDSHMCQSCCEIRDEADEALPALLAIARAANQFVNHPAGDREEYHDQYEACVKALAPFSAVSPPVSPGNEEGR